MFLSVRVHAISSVYIGVCLALFFFVHVFARYGRTNGRVGDTEKEEEEEAEYADGLPARPSFSFVVTSFPYIFLFYMPWYLFPSCDVT